MASQISELQDQERIQEVIDSVGLLFLLERKLEYLLDKILSPHDLTTKQWFVLAAVEKLYHQEPSIQEIARELATSHQNIKAIAVNLEKRGFIRLNKDPQDKRVTRLSVTTKSKEFWQKREKEDIENFLILFKHLTNEERVSLHKSLMKLLKEADSFTKRISKPKEEE